MRKTKIVCTLGPATDAPGVLENIMLAGMNVARFNFSHGTHEEQLVRLENFKALRQKLKLPVAALLDTKGPEIRLGVFESKEVKLTTGQSFVLTPRTVPGNKNMASISFKNLYADVSVGSRILIDDGKVEMKVSEICGQDIHCTVLNNGAVSSRKGINVPGIHFSMPYLSSQDEADILFGVENEFDFVAASFARTAKDILDIKQLLLRHNCPHMKVIAKIENEEGVLNLDEILEVSDGIMIARGDMGVEIDFTEIPVLQKSLIEKCCAAGKISITATQMLDSMMTNPRPTRAEITDVANAIYDGTSAIMLSGETAAGQHPLQAVQTMAAIAKRTEADIPFQDGIRRRRAKSGLLSVTESVAHATCNTATETGAAAIITASNSGDTARLISKYRPLAPIIACVMQPLFARQLNLCFGITPILMPYAHNTDELIEFSVIAAREAGLVEKGQLAIITAGVPVGISGTTNMMKAHYIEE